MSLDYFAIACQVNTCKVIPIPNTYRLSCFEWLINLHELFQHFFIVYEHQQLHVQTSDLMAIYQTSYLHLS